ncbi:unnamed protein product [Closterium sp. Naga37s-1]|nr:unnamed protein product [Closterium sp. Naga37s-1]
MRSQLEVNKQAGGSGGSSQAAPSSPTSSSAPPTDPQALAELNALLAFKASVLVFNDLLASWIVPRSAFNAPSASSASSPASPASSAFPAPSTASSAASAASPASPDPYSFLCAWRFVTCSPARPGGARRVVELSMTRFGPDLDQRPVLMLTRRSVLEGSWDGAGAGSDEGSTGDFSALTALTNLSIANNRDYREMAGLIGAFPSHLAACSSLQVLSLTGHRLLGPLPDSISLFSSLRHLQLTLHIPVLTPPFPPTAICASRHNTHPSLSPFPLSLSSLPFTLSPSLSPLPSLPFLSPLHPLPFPLSPSLSPFPLSPSPSPFPSLPFLSLLTHPHPLPYQLS